MKGNPSTLNRKCTVIKILLRVYLSRKYISSLKIKIYIKKILFIGFQVGIFLFTTFQIAILNLPVIVRLWLFNKVKYEDIILSFNCVFIILDIWLTKS